MEMMVCSSIPKSMKCWFLISWACIVYRTQAANLSGFHSLVYRFPDGGGHWVISTRGLIFLLMVSILVYFHHSFDDEVVYWLLCMLGYEFTKPIVFHDLGV